MRTGTCGSRGVTSGWSGDDADECDDQTIDVGDVATLVGPDRDETTPISVARNTGLQRDYWIMTKLNALLERRLV